MDVTDASVSIDLSSDQAHLNSITLVLGRAINAAFGSTMPEDEWHGLLEMLRRWSAAVPASIQPFSRASASTYGKSIPSIWMIQDCHG